MPDSLAFDVLLHLGTLLSVAIVCRRDLLRVLSGGFSLLAKPFGSRRKAERTPDETLFLLLFAASLPLIPAAFAEDRIVFLGSLPCAVGILLICNGVLLFAADRFPCGGKATERMGVLRALSVGCMQTLGVLPGISRSGSTIAGGRLAGLSGEEAVRFSFLLSVPAILGAFVFKLPDLFAGGLPAELLLPGLAGFLTAFAVGLVSIRLLRIFSRRTGFSAFGVYTVLAGAAAVAASRIAG